MAHILMRQEVRRTFRGAWEGKKSHSKIRGISHGCGKGNNSSSGKGRTGTYNTVVEKGRGSLGGEVLRKTRQKSTSERSKKQTTTEKEGRYKEGGVRGYVEKRRGTSRTHKKGGRYGKKRSGTKQLGLTS